MPSSRSTPISNPLELLRRSLRNRTGAARRTRPLGSGTLDVDVLLFENAQIDSADLTIPHPRMWERGFVLAPARDVRPTS